MFIPTNPSIGQIITLDGRDFKWDGEKWVRLENLAVGVEIVATLPPIGETGIFYLTPHPSPSSKNNHLAYIWVDEEQEFELLGEDLTLHNASVEAHQGVLLKISAQVGNKAEKIWVGEEEDFNSLTEENGTLYLILEPEGE